MFRKWRTEYGSQTGTAWHEHMHESWNLAQLNLRAPLAVLNLYQLLGQIYINGNIYRWCSPLQDSVEGRAVLRGA
jgi:hypothetical protein